MTKHPRVEGWRGVLLGVILVPAAGLAQEPAAPVELSPLQIDQDIQHFKAQVLDIEQQAETLEEGYLYPIDSRASFYIGGEPVGLLLSKLSLTLDGKTQVDYRYSHNEGVALQGHGDLQRLISCKLTPGAHHLHASFTAQYADAAPKDRPLTGAFDGSFNKDGGPVDIELLLSQPAPTAALTLTLKQHDATGADAYVAGGADDPRVRSAAFLADVGQYLSAAALLLRIQNESPQTTLAPAFYAQLAQDTLGFGMPQQSQEQLDGAAAAAMDPLARAQTRLRLAEFFYQRGYYDRATAELGSDQGQLPKEQGIDRQDLMSRILLQQEHYAEAAAVLGTPETAESLPLHMRYNLGIALIHGGSIDAGTKVLDQAGRTVATDQDQVALRDKINLSLGYYLLRNGQGKAAIATFGRVRSQGAFVTRAMLDMGWAYLGPAGVIQPAGNAAADGADPEASLASIGGLLRAGADKPDAATTHALRAVKLDKLNSHQQEQLRRALAIWVDLQTRDPMDPAVQEAMLAIPFALDRLGAHGEAQQYYEHAIDALETTRKHLQDTIDLVQSGHLTDAMLRRDENSETGWTWTLRDLPGSDATVYLQALLAQNSFQESLKNYRDVCLLQRTMQTWNRHLGDLQDLYTARAQDQAAAEPNATTVGNGAGAAPALSAEEAAHILMLANHLGEAVEQTGAAADGGQPPLALKLAGAPAHFEGFYERAQALRDRIAALQPSLDKSAEAQRGVLERVAMADLLQQKNLVETYMVQSRLALARIYDGASSGEKP